jgi:hypothetical protein
LALEYLRNVGIRAAKPDVHVLRILGGERLAYFLGKPAEREAVQLVADLATQIGCNETYLDNLLWLFCASVSLGLWGGSTFASKRAPRASCGN